MLQMYDKNNSIFWIGTDFKKSKDRDIIEKNIDILNGWQSQGIKDYLVENELLGNFFSETVKMMNDTKNEPFYFQFYAYDGRDMIGSVVIANSDSITGKYDFDNPTVFHSLDDIMVEGIPTMCTVFLAVDPNKQGQGYATRMINSISHNIQFFSKNKSVNGVYTMISTSNTPSRKAYLKNGYVKIKPKSPSVLRYVPRIELFYYHPMSADKVLANNSIGLKNTEDKVI